MSLLPTNSVGVVLDRTFPIRKAHRIVLVHKSDIEKALGLLEIARREDAKVAKMQTSERKAATKEALFDKPPSEDTREGMLNWYGKKS